MVEQTVCSTQKKTKLSKLELLWIFLLSVGIACFGAIALFDSLGYQNAIWPPWPLALICGFFVPCIPIFVFFSRMHSRSGVHFHGKT